MASTCCCSCPAAVRMMHGKSRQRSSLRIAERTSSPLKWGIMRSSMTRQMSPSRSSTCRASRPSYASVTRNGPCSSFILMMRPMCGSSSATRTWTVTSDQRGDMLAIAPQFVQQLPDLCAGLNEHQENRFCIQHRDDRHALTVLQDDRDRLTASRGAADFIRGANDRRNAGGEILGVEPGNGLAVDQQSVSSEHDGRIHSVALAQRGYQIANAGHVGLGLRR